MKIRAALFLVGLSWIACMFTPAAGAQETITCEQDYTVAAGDWLSNIAEKFYGDVRAYRAIFLATNLKSQTDPTYAALDNPDSIEVGAKLCIPSKDDAEVLLNSAAATPEATPTAPETITLTPEAAPATSELTTDATFTPSPTPTITPPASTAQGLRPADITFAPYGLGKEITGIVVPAQPYDNSSPPAPVGAPEHVAFQFDGTERLWVIPSEAYQTQWRAAGNNSVAQAVSQLRLLLRDKPEAPTPPLPFLPQEPATNDLAARVRYLDFNGGAGIAYIGRWAQDPSPVLASQTYFAFVGLTHDGKYLVSFKYPVHTSSLPDEVGELTPEHLAEIEADPRAYFAETTKLLDELKPSAFGPDLTRLDALVFSLNVPSTGALLPPPSGSLPTPPDGASTPGAVPTGGARTSDIRLRGTDWKWVETTTPTETIMVANPEQYTLRFNNAGGFGITADCNIGAGNYALNGDEIRIRDIQTTLAFCGEESLDAQFTAQLLSAAAYSFQDTLLLIHLAEDGGTMTFRR